MTNPRIIALEKNLSKPPQREYSEMNIFRFTMPFVLYEEHIDAELKRIVKLKEDIEELNTLKREIEELKKFEEEDVTLKKAIEKDIEYGYEPEIHKEYYSRQQ